MTTETPELDEQEAAAESAEKPTAGEQAALPAPAKTPFWQRPYVERYLAPLLMPVAVVVVVVMFAVNISRIFLSTHGNVDVIIGTGILLVILVGAALLSAAPRMRTASLTLITGGFVATVLMWGWLSLGTAEPEGEAGTTLPAEGPFSAQLDFESSNQLVFIPDTASVETGIANITMTNLGGEHTLHFEDGNTLFETLVVQAAGDTDASRAFFGEAGDYVFYCTVPGHREAGMEGVVTASGESTTLEAAEAAGGGGAETEGAPDEAGQPGDPGGSEAPAGGEDPGR
jgi:plastocyanin